MSLLKYSGGYRLDKVDDSCGERERERERERET